MRAPRLLVDISAHGFGHLSQTAPVLAALRRVRPDIELLVRSALPAELLSRRIEAPYAHLAVSSDFGFIMRNAIDIDVEASAQRYRQLHADWRGQVAAEAARLEALAPDLVFANAAYLPLAGAAAADIPAVGMCSLNWADLFASFHRGEPWAMAVEAEMIAAYAGADAFLRVTPGMPMSRLANRIDIGPIARVATAESLPERRVRLARALGLPEAGKWCLMAMGGMDFRVPVETWSADPDLCWICPAAWEMVGPNLGSFDQRLLARHALDFFDLLACADVVVTKPGYGTFAESVCNGIPLIYVPRGDWAEEAPMVDWAARHGRITALPRESLHGLDPRPMLDALWAQAAPARPAANGAEQAAKFLSGRIPPAAG